VGDSFVCKDRDGVKSIVYNVLIASSYIKTNYRKYEQKITDALCIKQVGGRLPYPFISFFPLLIVSCAVVGFFECDPLSIQRGGRVAIITLQSSRCNHHVSNILH
jgi:hypothetical protein